MTNVNQCSNDECRDPFRDGRRYVFVTDGGTEESLCDFCVLTSVIGIAESDAADILL